MKAVRKAKLSSSVAFVVEALEERQLMAVAWGNWPIKVGMDKVFSQYSWLNGGGNGVAVIDKGIDYWQPALGGNRATNTKSPRIVNVKDYRDGDTDPFPSESEVTDPTSPHGTGVAGILAAVPYDFDDPHNGDPAHHYQGILQNSLLYNLRTDRFNSQNTIKQALAWVLANHVQYHITAINLTDFVGTGSPTPVYANEVKALWEAGVFIATPVANDWNDADTPRQPIGYPAKSPYVYGTGGATLNNTLFVDTQRGANLDLVAPALGVSIPYYKPSTDTDENTDFGQGNSWGTPHTVGTAVLLQQIDPSITPAEIMQTLQDSGVPIVDPDPVSNPSGTITYKRLDIFAAVELAYTRRDDSNDAPKGGNDSMEKAAEITLNGSNAGSVSNQKLLIHDHDYFKFSVGSPSDFNINLGYSGDSPFPNAELLDANGDLVGNIDQNGSGSKRLPAGTYYIHLFNPTATLDGTYSVNINEDPVTPSAAGSDGTYNDIKYDASDNLNLVWYDNSTHTLKYSKRNTSSVWSTTQIIDSVPDVGQFVSMALDSAGKPGVAYYDATNGDLKYAHFNGSTWDVGAVDTTFTTGYYPSLKFLTNDRPVIAYYYKTGADLRLASYTGSAWSISTIDSKNDVGRYASLVANPATGRWSVAYEKTTGGEYRYAAQTKTSWNIATIDSNGIGGGYISLAFDNNQQPAFSYYDAMNSDLRFARFNGSTWSKTTVASKKSQGLYTNLFFDQGDNGNPVIYYYNKSANTLNAARNNGSVWNLEVLTTGGGRNNHVSQDSGFFESFSWQDDATGDVQVADL